MSFQSQGQRATNTAGPIVAIATREVGIVSRANLVRALAAQRLSAAVVGEFEEAAELLGEAGAEGDLGVVEAVPAFVRPGAAGFKYAGQARRRVALVGVEGHQAEAAGDDEALLIRLRGRGRVMGVGRGAEGEQGGGDGRSGGLTERGSHSAGW